ncbi:MULTISPECIES: hypothetical protein [unclassified Leeuwenhoekiella]|uniref:hypothetical protein n=1 Tax=unclassified Leeuwenhoekiella TaxID=2615029 RepID=UPI000C61F761|nr:MULTISPECIES: hypothetical protein [unclassified Leeuwenhoekiella]MAW95708.1 hypothetical protein [Leeuwenhoekiella sp.]MBA81218.1 hypothetical protein [Leeuwenhoekiella sp.]|tara:strand:+ start:1728 stop:2951 length:1224 start_codon:yes stop_codon:yes gene_type:complete
MRGLNITQTGIIKIALGILASASLLSCGTSQYAMNDGIYGSSSNTDYSRVNQQDVTTNSNGSRYADFFNQGAAEIDNAQEEGVIFTDIDSYSSTGDYTEEDLLLENDLAYNAQPGWGDTYDNVVVNVYNRPFWGAGWGGWGGPFYGNVGWGWGGFNNWGWGWNSPYNGWGWGSPFYGNIGWGYAYGGWGNPYWGYGFNRWGNPYWGYGFNTFYGYPYRNNWYNSRYNYNRIAYSNSRRGGRNDLGRTADSRSYSRSSRNTYSSNSRNSSRSSDVNYARTSRTYSRNGVGVDTRTRSRSASGNNSNSRVSRSSNANSRSIYSSSARRSSNSVSRSSGNTNSVNRSSSSRSSTYSRSSSPSRSSSTMSRSSSSSRSSAPSRASSSGGRSSSSGGGRSSSSGGRRGGGRG